MTAFSTAHTGGKASLATIADWLVIAVAISLPWSTSATAILVVLWAIPCIPTVGWGDIRREVLTAAGGLPVALVLLGVAGMVWFDVTFVERWKGFESFLKLLAIPLLLAQFRRSGRGEWVFAGYLWSCIALLVATTFVMAVPALSKSLLHHDSVLAKNAATQSGEFVTCIFGLLFFLIDAVDRRRWELVIGCSVIILAMLANILYVSTGRTALVVIVALLVVLAISRLCGFRGSVRVRVLQRMEICAEREGIHSRRIMPRGVRSDVCARRHALSAHVLAPDRRWIGAASRRID